MRTGLHCALLLLLLSPAGVRAEVVDRMVAVVNKQIILQSELEQDARVEFLLQVRPLDQLTGAEMEKVLDRMINQDLLQQQIAQSSVPDPTPQEIAASLREVRSQIPGASADDQWQVMLARYGVTERDVANRIFLQVKVLRFIDLRFRGLANVDKAAIDTYYQEEFVPEMRKQGAPVPPLNEVSGKLAQIMIEKRINEMLDEWLEKTLRGQAHIEKFNAEGAPLGEGVFGGAPESKEPKLPGKTSGVGSRIGARQ
ncbi:MAG TPA: hypothetical protein VG649_06910 [Candidatus Angelobacter sp.]|jgi:hypothetical protein|nr:hypothetical protein [Candidatus Angelobacter sp.]